MQINVDVLLALFILYQFKHFLADFVFQNVWMLQKARPGWDFVGPLSLHCIIHSFFTLLITLYFGWHLAWMAVLDFGVHFTMDRLKSGPRYLGRYSDMRSKAYWVIFGFDQMVHHLTHVYICWYVATHLTAT